MLKQSEVFDKSSHIKPFADHAECYKTKGGYIMIVSPYYDYKEEATLHGYEEIVALYDTACHTYMKKGFEKITYLKSSGHE